MKKSNSRERMCVYSLRAVAAMLEIPGGADAMEMLLLAAGYLTGAFRSHHPHLPYQRYLDLDYFLVIEKEHPEKFKTCTFCITSRGLEPVLEKLKQFGIHLRQHDDF